MEENKRKIIEERLFQLFAQKDQDKNENQLTKNISSGVKVIRRRKGKPDLHISWKKAFKAERSAFGWSGRGHLSPASGHLLEKPQADVWSRQYMNAVFYHNEEQRCLALASKAEVAQKTGRPVKSEVAPLRFFTMADTTRSIS